MNVPIVAAANQKGGVGKTSVVINLATIAHAKGKKAAIIDMDVEQGSATKWGQRRKLAGLNGVEVYPVKTHELQKTIEVLKSQGVEWIFLDLPGRDAPAASAGTVAADLAIIPCRPLEDDIEPSLATVGHIRARKGRYAYLMNIAPPQVDLSRARKVAEQLRDAGHKVSPVIIVQKIGVPDASARGLGINEREPDSKSAGEYADLFAWLESELLK